MAKDETGAAAGAGAEARPREKRGPRSGAGRRVRILSKAVTQPRRTVCLDRLCL